MSYNKETHVLMVTLPYQGRINPMLRFAKLLTSKGLNVTLATTEHGRNRVPKGFAKPNLIEIEFFDDGLDMQLDREKNIDILVEEYLPRDGARNLSNLIYNLENEGRKFSCIIINFFVPWVANVASTHNIPCAMLWIQSCATYAISYRYYKQLSNFPALDDPSNIVDLPGLPLLKVDDLPTFILPSSPTYFRNLVSMAINSLNQFKWIFGSSFKELEDNIVCSMSEYKPILPIGPLVPPMMLQETYEKDDNKGEGEDLCMSWLNKQRASSVIYIAMGSISVLSQNETEALAAVLENDHTSQFLWVRKKEENGWGRKMGELPNGFLDRTKDRGLVVSWCNQAKVLTHPAIECFLTHCGWNSTLETVSAGVPVIAYPDWTDQLTDTKLIIDVFNMGVRMRKNKDGELTKEEVGRCIMEVTKGPRAQTIKENAMKWKEAAKKATLPSGSSYKIVKNFINEIKAKTA